MADVVKAVDPLEILLVGQDLEVGGIAKRKPAGFVSVIKGQSGAGSIDAVTQAPLFTSASAT